MNASFHLSIEVRSLDGSTEFFVRVLNGSVQHRDPRGYINLDLFGAQITLHEARDAVPPRHFHFGFNLDLADFDALATHILEHDAAAVVSPPTVVDEGTAMERKKMSVRCPTGYLIELKGSSRGVA